MNMNQGISDDELRQARRVIRAVAEQNGVSAETVRREIMEAIHAGMDNPNPEIQARWKLIPWRSGTPTAEEFLAWNVRMVQETERSN